MTEVTAKAKKMNFKQASKLMGSVVDKKGNIVITTVLPQKNMYLVITIPKEAADTKIAEFNEKKMTPQAKKKALSDWINGLKNELLETY